MAALLTFLLLILLWTHAAPRCPGCGLTALPPPAQRRLLLAMAQRSILARLHLHEPPRPLQPPNRAALLSALYRVRPQLVAPQRPPGAAEQNYEVLSFAEAGPGSSQPVSIRLLNGDSKQNISVDTLDVNGDGWAMLDVSDELRSALNRGKEQLIIELSTTRPPGPPPLISDPYRPFVAIKARRGASNRRRRRGIDCGGSTRMCCRKDFYVDFKEIGWDGWIIQPEGYHMNYCAGLCPPHVAAVPGVAASFHTAVLNLIKANDAEAEADSCCVPTQRRPLSLLYYDRDSNIVKTDIPDMIVDACGCT
ncbi:inhibin beta C chain isoform X2 [Coturnix japonica]|uniref:inhibin beta C chain isoform X2 n=1 Tax=Coturnix japonica TaxID=93934 RepID=UPI0013A5E870|nr:inhibin beta C chain isoform X2 [Coturnix japonica]